MSFLAAVVRVALALLASGVAGWAVARFFTAGVSGMETLAWSFVTGLLAQSVALLGLLAARARPDAARILWADALLVGVSLVVRRPRRAIRSGAGGGASSGGVPIAILAGVAVAAWGLFLVQALAEPMWSTDYLAIWGLKGKTVFLTSALPRRLFDDPALYWSHPEYPLLVPLALAELASILGAWNDQALALFFPTCELATLLALGGFLARRVSRLAGAGAAALAALCFPLYRAVSTGTAEVPFALAVTLVACAVLDVLERESSASLMRLGAASLFCVATKQEGALFVLLSAGVLWARSLRPPGRPWRAGVAALLVPPILHGSLLYALRGPRTGRDFDLTLLAPQRWSQELPRLTTAVGQVLQTGAREALVPVAATALFLLLTRRGIGDPLIPIFAGQILGYTIAFSVSSFGPVYAVESAFGRIALALFPAFTIVLFARGMPGEVRTT